MLEPAIIAIAYNRPEALKRLLSSIENAVYPSGVSPELIISIDRSDSQDVVAVAEDFRYTHGKKTVLARTERMGLREHVLSCGDLSEKYGSIIVLEDDLYVAPAFYTYALKALSFSEGDERIGAVSLYNHRFNVHVREPFEAVDDGYDNWYLQMASSWGQAYTKKQWESFRKWYDDNKDRDLAAPTVPANISGWSERSWLKYYIVYLIETGKYCLYPRVSFTTNFADEGTHAQKADNDLQVPLSGAGRDVEPDFSGIDSSCSVYDAFFEPVGYMSGDDIRFGISPAETDGSSTDRILTDLYGYKPVADIIAESQKEDRIRYVLSSAPLPYACVKSFARRMRPHDANIIYNISGDVFRLYDTDRPGTVPAAENKALRYMYDHRGISVSKMVQIIKHRIFEGFGK